MPLCRYIVAQKADIAEAVGVGAVVYIWRSVQEEIA